jgi:hypothetical protein
MEQFDHKKAVEKLLNNVRSEFGSLFPYERGDYRFEVKDIKVEEPSVSYEAQQQAFLTDESIEAKVKGTVEVYHKDTLVKTHKDTVLTRIPYPTE